ncbi:MAG TPA: DNA polymerase III subunit gamma/tau, partial [Anaerolineae bacterium]|nr:DNA polymerase III subunit gamma/tau [Anaerolineae bacterium]
MASQALYRKWRSRTFEEIIGQQHVTQTLINALKLDRVAHAYLFSGPRGTGKTSTARLLAKAVNCLAEDPADRPCNRCAICQAVNEGRLMDLIEIDAASNTGVDDIRDLRDKVGFRPAEAKIKFYIIDEVHMLSNSAFNALLKTLEEPPAHVIFVLATTEPEKIPATITSRCQRFDFKRIKLDDVVDRLDYIITQEGFKADRDALEYIARQGSGSMRDAISLLDQMVAYSGEKISLELVQTVLGMVASQSVIGLVDALIEQDVATGLDIINQVVSDGLDPRQFAREIVEHLRAVMLVKLGNGAGLLTMPDETLAAVKRQAEWAGSSMIIKATAQFNSAAVDIKSGLLAIPQLPLELAFVESILAPAEMPAPEIASIPARPAVVSSRPEVRNTPPPPPKPAFIPTSGPPEVAIPADPPPELQFSLEDVRRCFEQVIQFIEPKSKPMAEALRAAKLQK